MFPVYPKPSRAKYVQEKARGERGDAVSFTEREQANEGYHGEGSSCWRSSRNVSYSNSCLRTHSEIPRFLHHYSSGLQPPTGICLDRRRRLVTWPEILSYEAYFCGEAET